MSTVRAQALGKTEPCVGCKNLKNPRVDSSSRGLVSSSRVILRTRQKAMAEQSLAGAAVPSRESTAYGKVLDWPNV